MLEYGWGNPSTIINTGDDGGAAIEPNETHRQIFDYNYTLVPDHFLTQPQHGPTPTTTTTTADFSHHHHFNPSQPHQHQHHPFFDPRAFPAASSTSLLSLDRNPPVNATLCGLGPDPGIGVLLIPKPEDVTRPMDFRGSGLGLNLGGRTYFPSSNDNIMNRVYRRSKTLESGYMTSSNSRRCQAEGCNVDLSDAKHYHRRHKVCEFHSKAATVIAAGLTQRFCQQCSRFHLLSEFDNGKRSCRKRLADHNRRRRKIQQPTQEIQKSQPTLDNITGSLPDSKAQYSSSSAKMAVSPPDYFR